MVGGRQRVPQQVAPDDVPDDRRRREGGFRHRQDPPGVGASQNWRLPIIEETLRPDRVRLVLPMVSLLPEEAVQRIKGRFGTKFKKLSPLEVQALVTAHLEEGVSNVRMRQICSKHPTELTKLLQSLVSRGFLQQDGRGRGTTYRLPGLGTPHITLGTPHTSGPWTPHISSKRFPKRSLRSSNSLRPQLFS